MPEDETQHAEGSLKVIAKRKAKTPHTLKRGPPHSRQPHGRKCVKRSLPPVVVVALAIAARTVGLAREPCNDPGRGGMSKGLENVRPRKVPLSDILKVKGTVESSFARVVVIGKDRGKPGPLEAIREPSDAAVEVGKVSGDRTRTTNGKAACASVDVKHHT